MRKTLLIAAATLAAGVISSQASVYSANIVGYVNQHLVGNFAYNFLTAPVGAPDKAEVLLSGIQSGDSLFFWNGGGYSSVSYVGTPNFNGGTNGYIWADADGNEIPSPVLNIGNGFLYQTGNGDATWTQNFVVPSN